MRASVKTVKRCGYYYVMEYGDVSVQCRTNVERALYPLYPFKILIIYDFPKPTRIRPLNKKKIQIERSSMYNTQFFFLLKKTIHRTMTFIRFFFRFISSSLLLTDFARCFDVKF